VNTTVFRYTLLRLRGQIIGWGLALAALALLVASLYDAALQMRAQLEQLLDTLPSELMMFVGGVDRVFSPAGFLDTRFFSIMPLLLGVFAVIFGSGLIAGDEENGTLDLILAHPVRRFDLIAGRWLAFCVALLGILAMAWLGLIIASSFTLIKFGGLDMALPFISLFGILIWFGGLALLLSMIVPSRRLAASLTGLILAASYFITTFAHISPNLIGLAQWSPLTYYQGGGALEGFNTGDFLGLLFMSLVFMASAMWLFQRRNIRIAGEGGWRLPLFKRKTQTT
jgi:ABC-2 type transport system permease protein